MLIWLDFVRLTMVIRSWQSSLGLFLDRVVPAFYWVISAKFRICNARRVRLKLMQQTQAQLVIFSQASPLLERRVIGV